MAADLKLTINDRYSLITLIFFIPYIIFEIPANIGIRKVGARIWLPTACLCWGIAMIGMGFAKDWTVLLGLRFVIGLFEAVLFPGAAYLLACWNIRSEVQTRLSFFYLLSAFASGFSAIISYGFSLMAGRGGLAGWSWIFIMCGILTCIVAFIGYFLIVDFPDSPRARKFLSAEEALLIKTRIERDRGDSVHDPLTLRKIGQYFQNPLYWAYCTMFGGTTLISYAFAYFLPLLLKGMGFSTANAQLLTAPPYGLALILGGIEGMLSDKFRTRSVFFLFNTGLNIIGCCLLGFTTPVALRYFGCFLCCAGANANVPIVVGWMHSCISGQSKRAFGSALVVAGGGIGGILASTTYMAKEAPTYKTGVYVTLGAQALIALIAIVLVAYFRMQNAKAQAGKINIQGVPGFRYML